MTFSFCNIHSDTHFQLVYEFEFPALRIGQVLGTEYQSRFVRLYCQEVPKEDVPNTVIEQYGPSEVFYRVKTLPSRILAQEPSRIAPVKIIPANPTRGTPEVRIPERFIRAVDERVKAMWTHEIFPSHFL